MKRAMSVAILAGLITLTGCNSTPKQESSGGAAAPVNTVCPVSGEKVDSKVTAMSGGKTVAFCCAGCKGKFEKADAKAQAEMLAKVSPK